MLILEHGKPMIFGKERDKGIRLNGMTPEVVELGNGITEADLLVHDETRDGPDDGVHPGAHAAGRSSRSRWASSAPSSARRTMS